MIENKQIVIDRRERQGLLAIGRDAHRFIFDKDAQCMDAIDEQRLVDLGRLIKGFGLGTWSNKKGVSYATN